MSLEKWLPPVAVRKKEDPAVVVKAEEKCVKCGNPISDKEPKFRLRIKGKENPYCMSCAKKILQPKENSEEDL